MLTIKLSRMCPYVFQHNNSLDSDIWNQDICLERGKTYLIESQSGTGKSSLCSYLCGYRNDYNGQLLFDNVDTRQYGVKEWTDIRRRHISHLPQNLRLFPELTALENIQIKNNLEKSLSETKIKEWLDFLGIADKHNTPIGKMSFGQQQRVAIIRTLAQPFDFLLADEPISHLDAENAQKLSELMLTEAKDRQASIVVTSVGKHPDIHYDYIYHL